MSAACSSGAPAPGSGRCSLAPSSAAAASASAGACAEGLPAPAAAAEGAAGVLFPAALVRKKYEFRAVGVIVLTRSGAPRARASSLHSRATRQGHGRKVSPGTLVRSRARRAAPGCTAPATAQPAWLNDRYDGHGGQGRSCAPAGAGHAASPQLVRHGAHCLLGGRVHAAALLRARNVHDVPPLLPPLHILSSAQGAGAGRGLSVGVQTWAGEHAPHSAGKRHACVPWQRQPTCPTHAGPCTGPACAHLRRTAALPARTPCPPCPPAQPPA